MGSLRIWCNFFAVTVDANAKRETENSAKTHRVTVLSEGVAILVTEDEYVEFDSDKLLSGCEI